MKENKDFGNNVKKFRLAKGLTQEQFSEAIGLEVQTVSRIETGNNFTSLPRLVKMTEILEVNIKDLFDFPDNKPTKEVIIALIVKLLYKISFDDVEIVYRLVYSLSLKNN